MTAHGKYTQSQFVVYYIIYGREARLICVVMTSGRIMVCVIVDS